MFPSFSCQTYFLLFPQTQAHFGVRYDLMNKWGFFPASTIWFIFPMPGRFFSLSFVSFTYRPGFLFLTCLPFFYFPKELIWIFMMLGKNEGGRRRGQQRMRCWMASPTQWTWVWVNSSVGDGQGGLECCSPWGHRVGHDWATEMNWKHLESDIHYNLSWINCYCFL